jgi:diacylglycerol kinase family enzyme
MKEVGENDEAAERVIIVFNRRSSNYRLVEKQVLRKAPEGYETYAVRPTSVDDNAAKLAKRIEDGDLIVSAGGDGTATIAANGILLSGKDARLAVLPYGNFNDMARTFGAKNLEDILEAGEEADEEVWPLEVIVDGEHFRYGVCYFTVGMFAEATEIFDLKDNRDYLKAKKGSVTYSLRVLISWYFQNMKKEFLPRFTLNGKRAKKGVSDYMAINGVSVARFMKGKRWYWGKMFSSTLLSGTNFWTLARFMMKAVLFGVPGREVKEDRVIFDEYADVEIQGEGEYKRLIGVKKIEVKKAERSLRVVSLRK